MISLILAILSSAMVAIMMRIAQPRVNHPTGLLASNYIFCSLMALFLSVPELPGMTPGDLGFPLGLGAVNGAMYLGSFALMQWNTRHNGVVLSSVFMKLGILVPTVLSVVWFRETPTIVQVIGFVVAIAAIFILNFQRGVTLSRSGWALILMLLVGGMGDGMSKIYEVYGDPGFRNLFLFFTFLAALILCLGLVASRKERLGLKALAYGAMLGIPNFLSSLFLLNALATVPAVIAFPTFSVAVILVVALAGVCFFHERLQPRQILGGMLICLALVLLNL